MKEFLRGPSLFWDWRILWDLTFFVDLNCLGPVFCELSAFGTSVFYATDADTGTVPAV